MTKMNLNKHTPAFKAKVALAATAAPMNGSNGRKENSTSSSAS